VSSLEISQQNGVEECGTEILCGKMVLVADLPLPKVKKVKQYIPVSKEGPENQNK
jgi:hypothetical protein